MVKRLLLLMVILSSLIMAEGDDGDLKISTWGWYTFGRVQSAYSERPLGEASAVFDIDFTDAFLSDFNAGIAITKAFDDYTKVRFHTGISTIFVTTDRDKPNIEFRKRRWGAYLIDAAFEYNPPMDSEDKLKLEFGYLPVKYNPEAVNLGAYLFRSTAYPSTIESGFELSTVVSPKQVGFHLDHQKMFGDNSWFKSEFYMATEMTYYPNFDFSPSLIFTGNFGNVLQLGVGGMYQNLISVDEEKTTPGKNPYHGGMYAERYVYNDSATMRPVLVQSINIFTGLPEWDTVNVFDTTYYSFRGLKLMGRLTFDPKPLFGMDDEDGILSPADLKIFGEGAILGVKNYPGWYNDITDRIPVMFGINLPTFRLLDILCFQVQYWKNPYWNTAENVWRFESPVPYVGDANPVKYDEWLANDSLYPKIHDDDVKWSIYMSKSILEKKLRFSLQFANDNFMKTGWMPPPPSQRKYTELTMRTAKDWYLMGRISFYLR
jgi:hypothetical protein